MEDLKESLINHSNCIHPSFEVVLYLFLSLKGRQSSILWSLLCRFHWLYHCCHSLSLIAICCHLLSLVVTRCTTRLSFYKRSHICRSSRLQMFFKIGALKNFAILRIKETPRQLFSCKTQPLEGLLKKGVLFLQANFNILIDFLLKMLG